MFGGCSLGDARFLLAPFFPERGACGKPVPFYAPATEDKHELSSQAPDGRRFARGFREGEAQAFPKGNHDSQPETSHLLPKAEAGEAIQGQ